MIRKSSLGDKFPRKIFHVQKTSLVVGLIAPNAVIDMLATILWVGNKKLKDDLINIVEVHEENIFIDSGLRQKERGWESHVKHWKEKWVEEVKSKFKSR